MPSLSKLLPLLALLFLCAAAEAQLLSPEEQKLFDAIAAYRKSASLPFIPVSPSLTKVARLHARDLSTARPDTGACNMHSWSDKGRWTPCCYTIDQSQAPCMWSKPQELTDYPGKGYEIAYMSSAGATAPAALAAWQSSPPHNEAILNKGIWKTTWQAIGIGIYEEYAVVWFGKVGDGE